MERDDLLLRAITEGATSSAALAERTGLSSASVWRGLRRLIASEYVFSPTRGVYRLTASGERVLAPPGPGAAATLTRGVSEAGPEPPVTLSVPRPDLGTSSGRADGATERHATVPTWLVGGAVVALGVGVIALLAIVARPPAPAPASVNPAPAVWPYNGQTWGM